VTGRDDKPAGTGPGKDNGRPESAAFVSRRSALAGGAAIVAASIFADASTPADAASAAQDGQALRPQTNLTSGESTMTNEEIEEALDKLATGFVEWPRAPLLHRPDEAGLDYENVFFPSEDGTPIQAWFIPRSGSDKIIICNHPRWFNRAGLPSHLEPWKSFGASAGNDFEVNFIPDYKILHDAGYNVLTYDMRNFGQSGAANGGVFSVGNFESRDVIGSLNYARARADTRGMTMGLFSRCVGGNATMYAMTRRPEAFDGVRCMVSPQPLSSGVALERALERLGIPQSYMGNLNERIQLKTSFTIDQFSPVPWAKNVMVPTFLYQVRDDLYTRPHDVQAMFDNLPVAEKKLYWIEGTTRRWDGYAYFQKDPVQMLEWFERFMG
jgi:hypothetical protein